MRKTRFYLRLKSEETAEHFRVRRSQLASYTAHAQSRLQPTDHVKTHLNSTIIAYYLRSLRALRWTETKTLTSVEHGAVQTTGHPPVRMTQARRLRVARTAPDLRQDLLTGKRAPEISPSDRQTTRTPADQVDHQPGDDFRSEQLLADFTQFQFSRSQTNSRRLIYVFSGQLSLLPSAGRKMSSILRATW